MLIQDIVTSALTELGVCGPNQGPYSGDLALGLTRANLILDTWNTQPGLPYYVDGLTATLTAGTAVYSVGPGLSPPNWNIPRPVKIDRVRLSISPSSGDMSPTIDIPVLNRSVGLDRIGRGSYNALPKFFTYIASWPSSLLAAYPTPDQNYSLVLNYPAQFAPFASLTATFSLPPGYAKLLTLQLAIELAPSFEKQPNPVTVEAYKDALMSIRALNAKKPATTPDSLAPRQRRHWDGYSDQWL